MIFMHKPDGKGQAERSISTFLLTCVHTTTGHWALNFILETLCSTISMDLCSSKFDSRMRQNRPG